MFIMFLFLLQIIMLFQDILIQWYQTHKRDLPWRHTQDPYLIWLSEVILQQTRVAQGLPYFNRFAEAYPTVQHLANASEQEVLRLWQGLGYYSRARNMHKTAQIVVNEHNGIFPNTYKGLLNLKGIGPYTAAAIASFAYNENVAVLDGNVFRVLARHFGIDTDIASTNGAKVFRALADELLPKYNSNIYNQAIMEFGALQCTPSNPNCLHCPLQHSCIAFSQRNQSSLPVKIKKLKIKHRYFHYFIFRQNEKLLMKVRTSGDIWQGLYDFYLIEHTEALETDNLLNHLTAKENMGDLKVISVSDEIKHVLTHQRIYARFWLIDLSSTNIPNLEQFEAYSLLQTRQLPKPVLVDNYLAKWFY